MFCMIWLDKARKLLVLLFVGVISHLSTGKIVYISKSVWAYMNSQSGFWEHVNSHLVFVRLEMYIWFA
jgi:hypothetical protein